MCEAVLAGSGYFLFVCKPTSHPLIQEYISGVDLPSHIIRVKRGREWVTHQFRWMNAVPLRDSMPGRSIGKKSPPTTRPTRSPIATASSLTCRSVTTTSRTCRLWTFNILKTDDYNLEHNFGHGKQNIAALLVTLNLLAFAFHTACDQTEPLWQLARSKTSSRVQFFSRLGAITTYLIFPSLDDLLQTLY
jgi:hypothetical protein